MDDQSVESLSALCSVEHFGLGRYGDPIDPDGWRKALKSFQRVLKPGGKLYLSVPVGKENRVCFNAHRIFHPSTIIETLDQMQIKEMSYISGLSETTFCIVEKLDAKTNKMYVDYDNEKLNNIKSNKLDPFTGLFELVKR
ncbi:DUF268 domain-containing protein [Helicobacter vulpis]|uniref:DUF268 domain-containing protein n=1 Tax=Helicobacter vulpis TaxID=2316076 RepID=UPI001F473146|nr:DUF268 domain-containing protein [Helicobacter vulpis]